MSERICIYCGDPALTSYDYRFWCSNRHKVLFEAEMTLWIAEPKLPDTVPQRCVLCGAWSGQPVCSLHKDDAVRLVRVAT